MPTPTKGPRLGGGPSHERVIIANLARALFDIGRIRTTEAKAKRLRPQAERLITFAKRGDVAARRQVLTVVRDKAVVHTLFAEIAPRFADRQPRHRFRFDLELVVQKQSDWHKLYAMALSDGPLLLRTPGRQWWLQAIGEPREVDYTVRANGESYYKAANVSFVEVATP